MQTYTPPNNQRLKVLVVEDSACSQSLAKRFLEKSGYDVGTASDGFEAIKLVKERDYDLILMDMQMPELDGVEATSIIRRRETHTRRHIPIIALTATEPKDIVKECIEAGMDGYIVKPINRKAFQRIVETLSEKHFFER
ncbi:MAG: response regulator [bacterium]